MTNYNFLFDLSELPTVAVAALSCWQVWQQVRDELLEVSTAADAVDLLSDYGFLSFDQNY